MVVGPTSAVTYQQETRHIHVFVKGSNSHLYRHSFDGSQWLWFDQRFPNEGDEYTETAVGGPPEVITYRDAGQRRIHAFVLGWDKQLHVNYWNGNQWQWRSQGFPPEVSNVYTAQSE
jgi:hypothetical protein